MNTNSQAIYSTESGKVLHIFFDGESKRKEGELYIETATRVNLRLGKAPASRGVALEFVKDGPKGMFNVISRGTAKEPIHENCFVIDDQYLPYPQRDQADFYLHQAKRKPNTLIMNMNTFWRVTDQAK